MGVKIERERERETDRQTETETETASIVHKEKFEGVRREIHGGCRVQLIYPIRNYP